jgi:hypothetical protein
LEGWGSKRTRQMMVEALVEEARERRSEERLL